jgi:hypothetical protein
VIENKQVATYPNVFKKMALEYNHLLKLYHRNGKASLEIE